MDSSKNGEVSEKNTDKEIQNGVFSDVTCDISENNSKAAHSDKDVSSECFQKLKGVSDDLHIDTLDMNENASQKTGSLDNLVELTVSDGVQSNHSSHLVSDANCSSNPKKDLDKNSTDSEVKSSAVNTIEVDSLIPTEISQNSVSSTKVADESQPSVTNSNTETINSNAPSDHESKLSEESACLVDSHCDSETDDELLSSSKVSSHQTTESFSKFCRDSASDTPKDDDLHIKLSNKLDLPISSAVATNQECNNTCLDSNETNSSDLAKEDSINMDSKPSEKLNQHLKPIDTKDEIVNPVPIFKTGLLQMQHLNNIGDDIDKLAPIIKIIASEQNVPGKELIKIDQLKPADVKDDTHKKAPVFKISLSKQSSRGIDSCRKEASVVRLKKSDSFVVTEISREESGFPEALAGLVDVGKYMHLKGDFTLRGSEGLLETPSLIAPYLLKEPDTFPPRPTDSKLEQRGFFDSSAGQMLIGIGLGRVSEWYHRDMTRIKKKLMKRKRKITQSEDALKMHETAYNESRKANKIFNFPLKTCETCGFSTESSIVMEGHLLIPHTNSKKEYRCNFCSTYDPNSKDMLILEHMYKAHGKIGYIPPSVQCFECPRCTFESHLKIKLGHHRSKFMHSYDPNQNQAPPEDFEFPALTPKLITVDVVNASPLSSLKKQRGRPKRMSNIAEKLRMNRYSPTVSHSPMLPILLPPFRPNSKPVLSDRVPSMSKKIMPPTHMFGPTHKNMFQLRPSLQSPMHLTPTNSFPQVKSSASSTPMIQNSPLATSSPQFPSNLSLVNASGVLNKNPTSAKQLINSFCSGGSQQQNPPRNAPEFTVMTLPKLQGPFPSLPVKPLSASTSNISSAFSTQSSMVMCEICDGYVKDLQQLRSHMQLIHKVKIHSKMLVSRPPLNCQKCQWRFFTDQGLERHLLGSHGLVTSNMHELANKNKDAGCCTICGRVYPNKLVSHMSEAHELTLKPAHLSYKCTVCSAKFNLYRLFENHVYLLHRDTKKLYGS